MLQKVIKVGNSAAVTIPKIILQETGLEIGDSVEVAGIKKPIKVEIIPRKTKVLRRGSGITKSFTRSVDEFIKTYRPVLEELAKR